ncbi:PAS domain S-box protein [candidate division TA06 bacterium]|nr:PAS domain S-box protein [candidate division TA06 bacterium]
MRAKAEKRATRELIVLLVILSVILLAIVLGSMYFYRRQAKTIAEAQKQNLAMVADLKCFMIENWYQERMNNAWGIADSRSFAETAFRWFANPADGSLKEAVATRIGSLMRYKQYSAILLLKPDGTVMMAANDTSKHTGPRVNGLTRQALNTRQIVTSDIYFCPVAKHPHLDFIAPINLGRKKVGVMLLRVDPKTYFYPFINNWPTSSRTSETLLIERDGDSVLFMNDVRHKKGTALKMREPLSKKELPAVMAVTGKTGTVEGRDYRGMPVLAAIRKISGTNWYMVAKVDSDEVYAPIKSLFTIIALLAVILSIAVTGAMGMVWYRRRHHYLRSIMTAEMQLQEANQKLIESNQELEASVEELTASEQELRTAEEELQQQYAQLQKSEERYHSTLDNMQEGCQIVDRNWRYVYINDAAERHNRKPKAEMLGNVMADMWPGIETTGVYAAERRCMEDAVSCIMENEFVFSDGTKGWFALSILPVPEGIFILSVDITLRKRAELEQKLTVEILQLLNRAEESHQIVEDILDTIKPITGCEALAIRLKDNGDYPYYMTNGFPKEFVEKERSLCARTIQGDLVTGPDGKPFLECMCGNIIKGRTDPTKSFFTPGGSFWSNYTSELLASTNDADRQTHTRNYCNKMGYESVALIPLKSEDDIIGLLQLNDRTKNKFTREFIEYLEGIGSSIGIALSRKKHQMEIQAQRQQLMANNEELMAAEQELKAAEEELKQQLEELVKNQEALYQSVEQFRLLFENAPDAIYIQIDGKFKYANTACLRLYAADKAGQLLGTAVSERIHPDCRELAGERDRTLIQERKAVPLVEYRHVRLDGTLVDVEVSAVPFVYKNESGALVFVRDISRRKSIEEELRHSQKIEAIGLLAGGVAHDFNNMLAGIIGNAELLTIKLLRDKELSGYVNNIANAAEHAASLTRQLLTFARKGQMIRQPVDIHKLITDTCNILGKTIDRRIMVKWNFGAPRPVVVGDPSQLENMLLNLGVNARDAMPKGGVLTYSTQEKLLDAGFIVGRGYSIEPGKYMLVSVSDTGCGMDEGTKRRIFEPFFTTKDSGKGTGLGLASVYGTVMSHLGVIEVESKLGEGATFNIYLPLAQAEVLVETEKDITISAESGHGRILLVDDEEMIRKMAENLLVYLGYEVHTCRDGAEAVSYYADNGKEINLVIMDMIMPVMNGMDAFLELKRINPSVKVLISSGFSASGETHEMLKLGVIDFIGKPYRVTELSAKIKKAIEGE